jgi:transposase
MNKRKRRYFSPEFKAEAVRLCRVGDRTITKVARDLDLTTSALRDWVRQADFEERAPTTVNSTSSESSELTELRKRVRQLEMEREILKKAAAFFAKENT